MTRTRHVSVVFESRVTWAAALSILDLGMM